MNPAPIVPPPPRQPPDARKSLTEHATEKGAALLEKYGSPITLADLRLILEDRSQVRYPCQLVFDAAALRPGEFAHPEPRGVAPEEGFTLYVHPHFSTQPERVPALVYYALVVINYGGFASAQDAESFGAAALGMEREDYYRLLCSAADELAAVASPGA